MGELTNCDTVSKLKGQADYYGEALIQQSAVNNYLSNENASLKETLDKIRMYCENQNPVDDLGWLSCTSANGVKKNILQIMKIDTISSSETVSKYMRFIGEEAFKQYVEPSQMQKPITEPCEWCDGKQKYKPIDSVSQITKYSWNICKFMDGRHVMKVWTELGTGMSGITFPIHNCPNCGHELV